MVTAVALLLLLNGKCKPESLQRDGRPGWRFPQTAGCKARTCFVDYELMVSRQRNEARMSPKNEVHFDALTEMEIAKKAHCERRAQARRLARGKNGGSSWAASNSKTCPRQQHKRQVQKDCLSSADRQNQCQTHSMTTRIVYVTSPR